MCGIVGAIAARDITPVLLDGLKRLEYRGYDSAGMAVIDGDQQLTRARSVGKVRELETVLAGNGLHGIAGIAHTRWATHGKVTESNAHPHVCRQSVAIVHNGIIENHEALKLQQVTKGYEFTSDTDTEVIVHQVYDYVQEGMDLFDAVRATVRDLHGAYSLGVISTSDPDHLVAARRGSPLVIGVGGAP